VVEPELRRSPPPGALVFMTSNAAVIVGAKGEGGQVAEGMRADLITVQGNPLEKLHVLVDKRNTTTVIKTGAVVDFGKVDEEIRQATPSARSPTPHLREAPRRGRPRRQNGPPLRQGGGPGPIGLDDRRRLDPRMVADACA
jgi:hypothetical protein